MTATTAYQPVLVPPLGFLASHYARETWRGLPGPTPVKVALVAVLAACLLVPGPFDELAVMGLCSVAAKRKARKAVAV